jgi:hypothetical protein
MPDMSPCQEVDLEEIGQSNSTKSWSWWGREAKTPISEPPEFQIFFATEKSTFLIRKTLEKIAISSFSHSKINFL